MNCDPLVPADAGTQIKQRRVGRLLWIPACAGMSGTRYLDRTVLKRQTK
jgi:hypothetical protein